MPQAVATRYARALVESVLNPGSKQDPKQVSGELVSFEELLEGTSELRNVHFHPRFRPRESAR